MVYCDDIKSQVVKEKIMTENGDIMKFTEKGWPQKQITWILLIIKFSRLEGKYRKPDNQSQLFLILSLAFALTDLNLSISADVIFLNVI